ncbi:MAG: DUF4062 domain-containing protein [Bifidobacteriaceae bacterium]|jgi:hypothetical protein|nr:DUF4062 domain-containing protein [Bifidobacteriaceae bacterium]
MAFQATVVRVMVASPSDVSTARDAIESALHMWNAASAGHRGVLLLPWRFETHAVPLAGAHPQAIINSQGLRDADIVFVVFGSRIGSPTPEAISGTAEEVEKAISAGKPVHIYFSSGPHPNDVDPQQLTVLRSFKEQLQSRALLGEFAQPSDLIQEVQEAIEHDLTELDLSAITSAAPAEVRPLIIQPKREREVKQDSKGKIGYTTRHWLEIANPNLEDAVGVTVEPREDQHFRVLWDTATVVHAQTTRTVPVVFTMGSGSNPVVIAKWTLGGEEFTKEYHIG